MIIKQDPEYIYMEQPAPVLRGRNRLFLPEPVVMNRLRKILIRVKMVLNRI